MLRTSPFRRSLLEAVLECSAVAAHDACASGTPVWRAACSSAACSSSQQCGQPWAAERQHIWGPRRLSSAAAGPSNLTPPVLNTEPRSLATTTKGPVQAQEEDLTKSIGNSSWLRRLLRFLGYYSSEALTIRGATGLYNAVCDQTDTNALHDTMELPPSFYSRWCLLTVHVWMLIVRLRAEGDGTKALRQEVYDLFQEDVEVRVRQQVSLRIAATVTELEKDFYGTALALDEAIQGKCEMWEPLLRNVYHSDEAKTLPAKRLAMYMTRELQCLEKTPVEALLAGKIRFTQLQ